MIEDTPNIYQFSRLYWNQMGTAVYGNIETAFSEFLKDCLKLPDGGKLLLKKIYKELIYMSNDETYNQWLSSARKEASTIKKWGGRFIWPDEARLLMSIMNEIDFGTDS